MKLLIDGNHLAHRTFATMGHLNNHTFRTGTTFGFFKSLTSAIQRFKPDSVIVFWDDRSKYRYDIYPIYKGKREKARKAKEKKNKDLNYDDLHKIDMPNTQKFIDYFGITQVKKKGFEGDDLIAQAALTSKESIIILSGDKDFFPLINHNISVYRPHVDTLFTLKNFYAKYGMTPNQFLYFLMMDGDSSDNILGVPGIGPKTAQKILNEYGSLSTFYKTYPNNIKKSKAEDQLLESKGLMILNKKLISLKFFVKEFNQDIQQEKNMLNFNGTFSKEAAIKGCKEFGFKSILKDLNYYLMPYRMMNMKGRK